MTAEYEKPHLATGEQIALLAKRGLHIDDSAKAEAALQRIGYYRLSEYWHPMRRAVTTRDDRGKPATQIFEDFQPGANFSDALALYVFDKRLRLIFLDAIERVEVALRVYCAHAFGSHDPYVHRDWRFFDSDFVSRNHADWLARIDRAAAKSREDFIHNFIKLYQPPLPIWVSIECWDFGTLSHFVGGLKGSEMSKLSAHYGLPRRDLLSSWVRAINGVRNVCAHHGRLWNRVLVDRPSPPRIGEHVELEHLARHVPAHNRIYAVAVALAWLLRYVNPNTTWRSRLGSLVQEFPANPLLSFNSSGFPEGWERQEIWSV